MAATDCLVLDQGFNPVETISWRKAVFKLLKDKVEVLDNHDMDIRSVTLSIKAPAVIRLIGGTRKKNKAVKFSRENVYDRDHGRCQYCGHFVDRREATYDHVTPRSMGGPTTWTNIAIACVGCNQRKGGRTPEQAGMRLRSVPVRPKKLPATLHVIMGWRQGMPDAWKQWMRDLSYWHGALEES